MFNIFILIIFMLSGFLYIYNNQHKDIRYNNDKDKTKEVIKLNNTKIKIIYLDDTKNNSKNTKENTNYKEKEEISIKNISTFTEKEVVKFIQNNNLIDVTPKSTSSNDENIPKRFSVYSNINIDEAKAKYGNTLPPPAPAIISGIIESDGSSYTVVIDGYINAVADTKIITSNDPDGEPLAAMDISNTVNEDDTQTEETTQENSSNENQSESIMLAPPSIGQN
jgi:hypothetical protein